MALAPVIGEAYKLMRDVLPALKSEWKKIAFELHPDRNGGDSAAFLEAQEAWNTIQRPDFPHMLWEIGQHARRQRQPPQPPPRPQGHFGDMHVEEYTIPHFGTIRVVMDPYTPGGSWKFTSTPAPATSTRTAGDDDDTNPFFVRKF